MCRYIFLILFSLPFFALAQHTNVMISNTPSAVIPDDTPEEPSIIINPKNTDHLVAGANLYHVYYSTDGGATWAEDTLVSPENGVWGDPVLIVDTAQSYYYFHLSNPPAGNWIDRIVCQKLDSMNATAWSNGTYFGLDGDKDQDKEWAVVNTANNEIYVTWTQFDDYSSTAPGDSSIILFTKSVDGGINWTTPIRISEIAGICLDSDSAAEGAVPTVGPNGEIYVAWSGPVGIRFDKSLDGGNAWLDHDILVSDQPGGWDYDIPGISRCNGLPVTCCDVSGGTYNGNIYVNWTDQRNGIDDTDVWMAKSTDGGNTWSAPKRVNDDPAGKHQFFTWMTVDQVTGHLYFVFYDRRNHNDNMTDVYMAVSKDGGETFINFKISESPFLPYSSVFFGDYTNITAHNNVVRPIWARQHQGELSIWTALINPNFLGIDQEQTGELSLDPNYPNPFTEETIFTFKLKEEATVSLKIFDARGKEIARLLDGVHMMPGKYIQRFNAWERNICPGVYYYSLITEEDSKTRRMVIVH